MKVLALEARWVFSPEGQAQAEKQALMQSNESTPEEKVEAIVLGRWA